MEKAVEFDVVIVGGGLAGATCALAVHAADPRCRIAVVEPYLLKQEYHPSFDDRSIALAAHSVDYLASIGLFKFQNDYMATIENVAVSDRGHTGKAWIAADEYGVDALGVVVEVAPFGLFLHQQLHAKNITLFCPDALKSLTQKSDVNVLTLESGITLSAKLLVVADGATSPTREQLNVAFNSVAYEQGALIANIGLKESHQGQAFERFTEHGPMALLPMSRGRYSLVWCLPNEQLEQYKNLPEGEFLAKLQAAFGYRAGVFTQVGARASYPLVLGRVERLTKHRTIFIGNAAHAIHPIAGQGFNLGLRDIQALSQLIAAATKAQLGDFRFTQQFEQARDEDINRVMWLTDALVRVFSNRSRVLALGRTLGLVAMTLSPTLKSPLAKQLMGKVSQGE
ncbi:2-octaprenyl-6-methoxyphenol hydroxylase [Pseudoalteromonas luteoviolacea B = ATCC 29581]|nr:2-octaprenyl-6-methoxyphenol hydroxylase [Pseudoalteromonas luteoviolacea B = ATCC 29581]